MWGGGEEQGLCSIGLAYGGTDAGSLFKKNRGGSAYGGAGLPILRESSRPTNHPTH